MTFQGISSAKAAKYYYDKDPYFNADDKEQNNIEWHGELKNQLGISGNDVSSEEASNLFRGKSLDGKEQLLDREKTTTNGKDNSVYDMPLSAPKSISAMGLMKGGDERIIEAHKKAVEKTAEYFEKELTQTRRYEKDEDGNKVRNTVKTGNALIATADHSTNRNNDVHLHTHMLVVNQTYDKQTDSYKALNLDFKAVKEIQAVYSSELRKEVQNLGYETQDKKNGWDLKGFDEKTISALSTRSNDIKDAMKEKIDNEGYNVDKNSARQIGFETKSDKDISVSKNDVQNRAESQLSSVGKTIEGLKSESLSNEPKEKYFKSEKEVLERAANHLVQNDARFSEKELLNAANSIARGEYSYKDLKEELKGVQKEGQTNPTELKRLGTDEKGNEVFTTKGMNTIEKENDAFVKNNKDIGGILTVEQAERGIAAFEKSKKYVLTDGQKDAVMKSLTSNKQIVMWEGVAGSGKSTAFSAINYTLAYNGRGDVPVLVAAPSNKALTGAKEASKVEGASPFKGLTLFKAEKGGLLEAFSFKSAESEGQKIEKEDYTYKQKNLVNSLNKSSDINFGGNNFKDINLATGNKGFDDNMAKWLKTGPFAIKKTDTKQSKEVSRTGETVIKKDTIVKYGENRGARKAEKITIGKGGSTMTYESLIQNNKGETFKQKVETYTPIKMGKNGSLMSKAAASMLSKTSRTVENKDGKSKEDTFSFAGFKMVKKTAENDKAQQSKFGVSAYGGLIKSELNIMSIKQDDGTFKDITTKTNSFMGLSYTTTTNESNKGTSKDSKLSFMGLMSYESKSAFTDNMKQEKSGVKLLAGAFHYQENSTRRETKNGFIDTNEKSGGFLGFKLKVTTQEALDKEGNVVGKTTTREKSFLGLTYGKATVLDQDKVQTYSYTKTNKTEEMIEKDEKLKYADNKVVNELKLTSEHNVSDKKDFDEMSKKMDNNQKIEKEGPKQALFIVDEASMMSAKDFNGLNKQIEELKNDYGIDVKSNYIGDGNQLLSIGAGDTFKQSVKSSEKDSVAELPDSQRQRNEVEKHLADNLSAKDVKTAIDGMKDSGNIQEVKDYDKRISAAVDAITKKESVETTGFDGKAKMTDMDYRNTIGLAATNAENKDINQGVRNKLKEDGVITDEVKVNINVDVLKNKISQSNASNYDKGMKVVTFEGAKGMNKNTQYEVVGVNEGKNQLKLKTTEPDKKGNHSFTMVNANDIAGKVTVSKEEEREFGKGDKIIITKTDKEAKLANSDLGLIVDIDKDKKVAKVDFGEQGIKNVDLVKNNGVEHGYSMTVHKSQGVSVDRVVAVFDTAKNGMMNTMNSVYVALSRQKAKAVAIVDDVKNFVNQASKQAQNVSSLDDLSKKEVKLDNKADVKTTNEIKDFKQNNDVPKRDGNYVSSQKAFNESKEIGKLRDQAQNNKDVDTYKQKAGEFMNKQIVARNGYSEKTVENFANQQVEKGYMTNNAAKNFVENSHNNAKELENSGILKSNGKGEYSFVDNKAKEILNDNGHKKMDDIAKINLDSMKDTVKKDVESNKSVQNNKVDSNDKSNLLDNKNNVSNKNNSQVKNDVESNKNIQNNKVDSDKNNSQAKNDSNDKNVSNNDKNQAKKDVESNKSVQNNKVDSSDKSNLLDNKNNVSDKNNNQIKNDVESNKNVQNNKVDSNDKSNSLDNKNNVSDKNNSQIKNDSYDTNDSRKKLDDLINQLNNKKDNTDSSDSKNNSLNNTKNENSSLDKNESNKNDVPDKNNKSDKELEKVQRNELINNDGLGKKNDLEHSDKQSKKDNTHTR